MAKQRLTESCILYKKDITKVIERAKKENIIIITNGVEFNTNEIALKLAEKYDTKIISKKYIQYILD